MPSGPAWAWRVGLVAAWFLAPTRARAASLPDDQTHALPCRPTIACTADLVDPGILELEVGYLHRRLSDEVNQESVPFLLKLTLARWVQLQVGGNGPTFANGPVSTRYVDDVTGGFKFHLTDQAGWMPSTSVSAVLSVPLAPAAGYLRTYDALLTVYVTKDFGWLHADLNVGLNLWRLEGPLASQPWAALAVSVSLPAGFGAMLETYLFADAALVSRKDAGVLTAVSYSVRAWLILDAGVDVGLVHSTRVWSAFAGVTVIPVRFWKGRPPVTSGGS